jgi:protein ImuB
VAPTPRAALWLARGADGVVVTEAGGLNARLGRLALVHTGWPARTLQALEEMGIERIGECLRLPRDGFARRLGHRHLADLDRALGRLPEPRTGFRAPETYTGRLELPAESLDSEQLCQGMSRLLAELGGFLRARGGGVQQPVCGFVHAAGPPTTITLELSRPTDSADLLGELLTERLERCGFPAPVIELTLASGPVIAAEAAQPDLHEAGDEGTRPVAGEDRRLIDRLRARLGEDSVRGVGLHEDHRPERAWRFQGAGAPSAGPSRRRRGQRPATPDPAAAQARFDRPLWILEHPRALAVHEGRPWLEGRLTCLAGPERIETGWWDGAGVSRDYFVAVNPAGMRLWIYRERRGARRWFLHGMFG